MVDPSSEKNNIQNSLQNKEEIAQTKHLLELQEDLQKQELAKVSKKNKVEQESVHKEGQKTGMSLSFKISGSIVLLIVIIAVISTTFLFGTNRLEESLYTIRTTSKIARISSEMKSIVYKILLSQTSYVQSHYLGEKQDDYLRLMAQDLDKLKKELDNIETVVANSQLRFTYNDTDIKEIQRLIDIYENESSNQRLLIQKADETNKLSSSKVKELQQELLSIINTVIFSLEETADEYWIQLKKAESSNFNISTIQIIEQMKATLLKIKLSIEMLILKNDLEASATELHIQFFLELTEKILASSHDEKILLGITRAKGDIKKCAVVLKKYISEIKKNYSEQQNIRDQIVIHKKNLSDEGKKLLKSLHVITDNNWNIVEDYRRQMDAIHANNFYVLYAMTGISLVLGGLVLFFIPRPITRVIAELVDSSSAIARGNLQNKVESHSNDELGTLAYMMEKMRDSLLRLIRQISEAAINMSTMTNQVVASSNQQSTSSSEISAQISQLTSSINEQLASMSELKQSLSGVSDFTQNSTSKAKQSADKAQIALSGMNRIADANTRVSERIQLLREKIEEATKILTVISEVADQTNMLSLNASIEATKAGEAGKGFTIVANEVRRLADRSMMAARNVHDIVHDIQRAAESAVMSMQKSSEEIRTGSEAVSSTVTNLSEIANNMNQISGQTHTMLTVISQQTDTFKGTSDSVQNIASATAISANAAHQIYEVINNLNELAQQLRNAIVKFSI